MLDGHRLAVHDGRRGLERRYVLDLRFIAEAPLTTRTVAWNCWFASLASLAAAGLVAWLAWTQRAHPQVWSAWVVTMGLSGTALLVGAVALYRTYDTTLLYSVHGRVTLARLTGTLGSSRHAATFTAELTRSIGAARAAVVQSRQAFLRDELREHRRLFEDGVLSAEAYEAGKRRILQAHD